MREERERTRIYWERMWDLIGKYQITLDRAHENFVIRRLSLFLSPRVTGQFRRRHETPLPRAAPYFLRRTLNSWLYMCRITRVH